MTLLARVRRGHAAGLGLSVLVAALIGAGVGPAAALSIPATTVINDASFVSASTGWVLTADTCGSSSCTKVLATGDRGRSFTALSSPTGQPSAIRLASARDGYVFGTGSGAFLQSSHDGGKTWRKVGGTGHVLDLRVSRGRVYLLQATGRGSVRVLSSPVARDSFTPESTAPLPEMSRQTIAPAAPVLASGGGRVYAATVGSERGTDTAHAGGVLVVRSGNSSWDRHPLPGHCDRSFNLALTTTGSAGVTLLCSLDSGAGTQKKQLWSSTNAGTSWRQLADPPLGGYATSVVTVGGGLAIGGSRLGIEVARDRRHWAETFGDGLGGDVSVTSLQFSDTAHGTAVARLGDASFALVTSNDGGGHWRTATGLTIDRPVDANPGPSPTPTPTASPTPSAS